MSPVTDGWLAQLVMGVRKMKTVLSDCSFWRWLRPCCVAAHDLSSAALFRRGTVNWDGTLGTRRRRRATPRDERRFPFGPGPGPVGSGDCPTTWRVPVLRTAYWAITRSGVPPLRKAFPSGNSARQRGLLEWATATEPAPRHGRNACHARSDVPSQFLVPRRIPFRHGKATRAFRLTVNPMADPPSAAA